MWKLRPFVPFFLTLVIFGCSRNTDTNPDPPNPNPPGPNPNPPVVGIVGCKACEYYPVCDSTWYTYLDSVYPAAPVLYTDTLKAGADTTINGLVYKKTSRISSRYPSTEYINCLNGVYRVAGKYGMGVTPWAILKVNEPVGASWVEYPFPDVTVTVTMMSKGLTVRVNNRDYPDVIKVKLTISGRGSVYSADYYFAKGVGIIKFEFGNWNFDGSWYHRNNLQSFYIPQ